MAGPNSNIPTRSFYGNNKSKRVLDIEARLEEGVSSLKKRPLPPELKSTLLGPPKVWKVFLKQDEALHFAKEHGGNLMTFAFEERVPGGEGRRKYMVTHPAHMWTAQANRPPAERCTYEVIPQGSPCKLYFDLEFSKLLNPTCDGEAMVEILLKACFWAFLEIFDCHVSLEDVLILDASTDHKFSQHLVFQSTLRAFQDNIQAGNFTRYIVGQLKERKVPGLTEEEQKSLFVRADGKDEPVSFCDLSVYTKNRNFRLFLSTKFGKNVPLVVGRNNRHCPSASDGSSMDAAFFSASLITNLEPNVEQLLGFLGSSSDGSQSAVVKTLNSSDPSLNGYSGSSPWSEIDRFINGLVAPTGGSVHRWVYYEKSETIVYLIQGSRYCSSIGRQHKRNNVKYVVHLPNATYYQSCFDPDCAQSRPTPQPIPPEHLPWSGMLSADSDV